MSWVRRAGGFTLYCNRDERHERGPELPAALLELPGARALAPRDSERGGTWLAVNEHGLSLCVLNGYIEADARGPASLRSRGLLALDLADARGIDELAARCAQIEPERYASFVLLALEPDRDAWVLEWDGRERVVRAADEVAMPLISSSNEPEVVRARRAALLHARGLERTALEPELLESFHASHEGGPSAWSVCMHRADAETRSSCRVVVDRKAVRLRHTPGPPCRTRPLPELALARAAAIDAR